MKKVKTRLPKEPFFLGQRVRLKPAINFKDLESIHITDIKFKKAIKNAPYGIVGQELNNQLIVEFPELGGDAFWFPKNFLMGIPEAPEDTRDYLEAITGFAAET